MIKFLAIPALGLSLVTALSFGAIAHAGSAFDHSTAAVGHSGAAASHGASAVGAVAVTAVAVPMVVVGETARAAGQLVGGTGAKLLENTRRPLVIETDQVIINNKADAPPTLD